MAEAIGADWRMDPSPKYSVCEFIAIGVAGNTNGMAEEASRWSCVMRPGIAMRCERTQGCIGVADS